MCRPVAIVGFILIVSTASAASSDFSRSIKLSKGEAKIQFTAETPDSERSGPAKSPHVGTAPSASPSFGNFLAQQLDESGRAVVVPPSRLSAGRSLGGGFDALMRADLQEAITATCRQGKLDYVLLMGNPQTSMKTDVSTYIFLVGRMRMRNRHEAKLYDCRTLKSVWAQSVLFETSQGALSSAFTGNTLGGLVGGPEAERAMAKVYAEKLTADMSW